MSVWNSGNPPGVGWWQASINRDLTMWRWWNGRGWGRACLASDHISDVVRSASFSSMPKGLEWTWHWPENARVARPPYSRWQTMYVWHLEGRQHTLKQTGENLNDAFSKLQVSVRDLITTHGISTSEEHVYDPTTLTG